MKTRNLLIACLMGIAVLGAAGVARAGDVRMFVRHEVVDYSAWRKSYNEFVSIQKKNGVFYQAVYQSADDPNDVTVALPVRTLSVGGDLPSSGTFTGYSSSASFLPLTVVAVGCLAQPRRTRSASGSAA